MKKLIIATCAASLFSTATLAAPKQVQKHQRHNASQHHQSHEKSDFSRNLLYLALFAGAAIAIDAALDEENYHDSTKPHRPHHGNTKPNRPHSAHPSNRAHALAINARQDRQAKRIRHGVKSGELIRPEAKRLRKQQRRIARLEQEFRSDGRFTKKERRIIQAKLDNASQRIYALKHNDRYRY